MRKVYYLIVFCALFVSMNIFSEDKIFLMNKYVAKLASDGVLSIDIEGKKAIKIPLMTFSDKSPKLIQVYPPRRNFKPILNIKESLNKVELSIKYKKDGLITKFSKKVLLTPNAITLISKVIPFRKFFTINNGIELEPELFDRATYIAKKRGDILTGKLSTDIPSKSVYILNSLGHLSNISFNIPKFAKISFEFNEGNEHGFADYRAARWLQKYKLHYRILSINGGEEFTYQLKITINESQKTKNSTLKSDLNKEIKIKKEDLTLSEGVLFDLNFNNQYSANANGNGEVQNKNLPKFIDGVSGKGVYFSFGKTLQYLENKNLNKSKGTISMWVKSDPIQDPYYTKSPLRTLFTESGKASPGSNVMNLAKATWGGLRFNLRNKFNYYWGIDDIYNWQFSKWHFIAVTWNNKKGVSIYLDGELSQASEVEKGRHGLAPLKWFPVPAKYIFFGARNKAGYAPWNGGMDEIRIFNRDLTASEVYKEYKRFAKSKINISVSKRYFFVDRDEKCDLLLSNHSDNNINFAGKFNIQNSKGDIVKSGEFPDTLIKRSNKNSVSISFLFSVSGNYTLNILSEKNIVTNSFNLLFLKEKEETIGGDKFDLELISTIDPTIKNRNSVIYKGDYSVINSAIGKYLEAGSKRDSRFAIGFEVPEVNKPYMVVVTWPDNGPRSMEILLHQTGTTRYQNHAGLFAGDIFASSGTMKEFRFVCWPESKKMAIIFMTLEDGYPAAVKDVKIFKINSEIPKMKIHPFKGKLPPREIGFFFEDPVLPMCFGAGSLFPKFEQTVTRFLDYAQMFGQNVLTYPVVWYDGPLYGSKIEPFVPSKAIRIHPDDYPNYLIKRLEARNMKFNGMLKIKCLESLDKIAIIDEYKVLKGTETIVNMRYDNHLQLTTGWNTIVPRYNTLDPIVQKAVINIVEEIIDRYGDNKAFNGLTIVNNGTNIFSLGLGGIKGGYNDINLIRFQKDTGIKILDYNAKDIYRFTKSYKWLMSNAKNSWITWRCQQIHDFGMFHI